MKHLISENGKRFIESLFEIRKKDYNKAVSASMRFSGEKMMSGSEIKAEYAKDYRVFIYLHYKRMRNKRMYEVNSEEDKVALYSVALSEAVATLGNRFPSMEVFSGNDKRNRKIELETLKYIRKSIEHSLYRLMNPEAFQTKVKDKNIFVHPLFTSSIESHQQAYESSDRGEFELTERNRLIGVSEGSEDEYQYNYYLRHFLKNKKRILTAKQLEFYEAIKDVYVAKGSEISKKKTYENAGYTVNQAHKFISNIAKRMEEDFEKFGHKRAVNYDSRKKLRDVLINFINVANSEDNIKNMQMNLSRIIQDNYEDVNFEVIITKGLSSEERINVVRSVKGKCYVNNKVLYKIYENVDVYLKENELVDIKASEAKSTYSESLITERDGLSNHYTLNTFGMVESLNFEDIEEE